MSWHFSQELVAAYSADTCSDGAPSAPLSGNPTPQAYLSPDRMTAFCRLSRFGMTCEPLTDALGAAVLTWCLAASHAKTSAQPVKVQASTASEAECGTTWRGSLARYDRATSSWKTPQCSLLEDLDVFSETWPRWGMMLRGECSEQSMPAHLIKETGSGSRPMLPTPLASITDHGGPNQRDSSGRPGLQMAAMMWPTPSANKQTASGELVNADGKPWDGMSKPHSKKTGAPVQTALLDKVRMWPTPTVQDSKNNGAPSQMERNTKPLNAEVGGSLNPTWVEWLMGWPLGWTDLKPLETDKFQQWQHSHGKFYQNA